MRKATKTIISFAVILIAGLNFIIPAFAQDPFTAIAVGGLTGASGAGLFGSMAGMSGINIGWSQSGADPMDAMWNVLNPDHVYFSGKKHEATDIDEDVYDYINVDIGDWLQAQSDFIVNFAQTHNVTDNSSGTVTTNRQYQGVPIYYVNGSWVYSDVADVQSISATAGAHYVFTLDQYRFEITYNSGISWNVKAYIGDTLDYNQNQNIGSDFTTLGICYRVLSSSPNNVYFSLTKSDRSIALISRPTNQTSVAGTDIPWTSSTVDTGVFDGWESAKVKIPHSISQLQTGWTLPDFLAELDRIWTGAGEDQIIIEDGGDTPVPPVPVPDTPLGEVPFDDWVDLWGQGIYQQLEDQSDALDLIGSNGIDAIEELESIDTNTEDLVEVAESIDTNIGVGNGILGGIRSLAQSAVNYLEGIAEHVGELVEEIVEGTETLIAGILNQIPSVFSVIFGPIKQASSIWHYVVEWIQSIGAPFQFIWSMASGTSYYIILPVYASLAAAVVLAFYKRFGK